MQCLNSVVLHENLAAAGLSNMPVRSCLAAKLSKALAAEMGSRDLEIKSEMATKDLTAMFSPSTEQQRTVWHTALKMRKPAALRSGGSH